MQTTDKIIKQLGFGELTVQVWRTDGSTVAMCEHQSHGNHGWTGYSYAATPAGASDAIAQADEHIDAHLAGRYAGVAGSQLHSKRCLARAVICAVENLRDLEGEDASTFQRELVRNTPLEWAQGYLADGTCSCVCAADGFDPESARSFIQATELGDAIANTSKAGA